MHIHRQFIWCKTLFVKCILLQTITMNPSDWIKPATLVTQQKQEAVTTDTDQLSSKPLSQLAMDDSSPPVVHYGMHMPAATSTPTHTEVHTHSSQQELLSVNNTRYPSGFIIPHLVITQLRSNNFFRRGTNTSR